MRRVLISLFMIALITSMVSYKYSVAKDYESDLEVLINLKDDEVFVEEEFEVEIRVKNNSEEKKELNFNTGQRFDIIVLGTKEELLYRWSDDKMFTQALGSLVLEPEEEKAYNAQVILPNEINPGDYKILGMITAEDEIFSQTKTITIKEK